MTAVLSIAAFAAVGAQPLSVTPVKTVPGARILALAPGHVGSRFVASMENRAIRLYNASDRMIIREFQGHPQPAYAVACSDDGKRIASGDESGRIFVWHVASGGKAIEIRPHIRGVQALCFSKDGKRLLSTGKDDTVKVIDIASGKVLKNILGKGANLYSAKYLPGSEQWGVGTLGSGAKVYGGAQEVRFMGHADNSVFDVDFHPPSKRALTAGRDATAMVWDLKTGKRIQTLRGHGDWVVHASFTPNGRFAATSSSDRTVKVWDMKSFACVKTLDNESAVGSPLCVTPDGQYLITASIDDSLQVNFLSPAQGASVGRRRKP